MPLKDKKFIKENLKKNTLTNPQIANYRRDGFIVIEDVFDHNELEDWRSK